jgi:hypothetical protein
MMKSTLILLVLFSAFSSLATAQDLNGAVDVSAGSPRLVQTDPGSIVTISFLISDRSGEEEEFREELMLPPGWQEAVADEPVLALKPGESQVRVFAFLVPPSAQAGTYRIYYHLGSQEDPGAAATDSVMVEVLPVTELTLSILDKPPPVIAGETYQMDLLVTNRGNSQVEVRLGAKSSPDGAVRIDPDSMRLEAGESRPATAEIRTDFRLGRKTTQIVHLTAQGKTPTGGMVGSKQVISVEVLPQVTAAPDPYLRLPGKACLIAAGQDGKAGLQLDVSGWGDLDEGGKRKVDFQFRGPDIQGKSMWGKKDELRLSYRQEHLELHLGDRGFSLSPLTQRFAYGRGVEVDFRQGRLRGGALYVKDRWGEPRPELTGGYLAYRAGEKIDLKANLLSKSRDSTLSVEGYDLRIYSLQTELDLHPGMKLDLECALGEGQRDGRSSGLALRLNSTGRLWDRVSYSVEKTHASPEYFGYYNDADYSSGSVSFDVWRGLRANLFYRSHKNNLDADSALGPANREESYQAGFRYRFRSGPEVSAEYRTLDRRDDILPPDYHYREKAARVGVTQTWGRLRVNAQVERGEFEDRLTSARNDDLERYHLYASFHPSYRQSLSLYVRVGHSSFTGTPERTKSFGASGSWLVSGNLSLSLDLRRDESGSSQCGNRQSLLCSVGYTFANGHGLSLKSQWFRYDQTKEKDVSLLASYTVPLRIPVGKKRSMGVLKGQVLDRESPDRPPLSRVILSADGFTAVTDDQGEFVFPSLAPGTHYLRVESSSIGLDRVITAKQPVAVEVKGGKTAEIDIGVVSSCTISGRVLISRPDSNRSSATVDFAAKDSLYIVGSGAQESSTSDLAGKEGLANVLVEIRDPQEVLRQLTDPEGGFSFQGIRPGVWTLRVYDDGLPPQHYLEKDEARLELKPGEKSETTIRVLPRLRPIQIIEEGELD